MQIFFWGVKKAFRGSVTFLRLFLRGSLNSEIFLELKKFLRAFQTKFVDNPVKYFLNPSKIPIKIPENPLNTNIQTINVFQMNFPTIFFDFFFKKIIFIKNLTRILMIKKVMHVICFRKYFL